MGGVSLHGVASATNIESAGWSSTSSAANVSYYIQMPPSPPRLDRAACVATSMGGVSLHGVASATNIKSASWSSTSSAANVSYYIQMSPPTPRLDRAACVATSMGGVSLHGVASATNIESAGWSSTSSAANVSYYIQMPPSPPRLDRAACVATSMGGVSLHGVASATNIKSASWSSTSSASNPSYDYKTVTVASPSRPCCLRRHINGRSESPRRGERHQHRVRELGLHQQRLKCVVRLQNCHRRLPVSTVLLASPHQWAE
ncbi:hypothetical protein PF003_g41010 [Phytophthora fragariae]|nr:hypothetical protein PF003_g41010 [Phytophthora fragariae]